MVQTNIKLLRCASLYVISQSFRISVSPWGTTCNPRNSSSSTTTAKETSPFWGEHTHTHDVTGLVRQPN